MLRTLLLLWAAVVLTAAGPLATAAAQEDAPSETFSANNFVPAMGPDNFVMVDGAMVAGHMAPSAQVFLDYGHRPLVIYQASCSDGDSNCEIESGGETDAVSYMLTTTLGGTMTFVNIVQVGLQVPLIATAGDGFYRSRGDNAGQPVVIPGGEAFAIGDPRICAKAKAYGEGASGFYLGGSLCGTIPVGDKLAPDQSVGAGGFAGGPGLIAEYRVDKIRAAVNVGYMMLPRRELLSTVRDDNLSYGLAGSYDVTSLLQVVGEVTGSTQFSTQLDENPVEARVMAKLTQGDLHFALGTGAGLVSGVGIPTFRVLGGASWEPATMDSDGDGVLDKNDSCPTHAEDLDGYLDGDGCPEADNDGDGMPDGSDKCPDAAEDIDTFEDEDGCPDEDNDNDGVQDGYDSCPLQPEDKDGDRDDDGCPDNDTDRDGVDDDVDQCPREPEDTDGFGDEDGCPEEDFDGDGVPDDVDECPDEVENIDGIEDEDGCPEVEEEG